MIKAVRHFGIVVSDLEQSLYFYRDLLGLKVLKIAEEAGNYLDNMLALQNVEVTTVKLSAAGDSAVVELLNFKNPKSEKQFKRRIFDIGPTHIAFTVNDLEQLYQKLLNAGISCNASPQLPPGSNVKVTFCHDPDGTAIELVQMMNEV